MLIPSVLIRIVLVRIVLVRIVLLRFRAGGRAGGGRLRRPFGAGFGGPGVAVALSRRFSLLSMIGVKEVWDFNLPPSGPQLSPILPQLAPKESEVTQILGDLRVAFWWSQIVAGARPM